MLDTWERGVTEDVIERIEHDGGDARERLGRLFDFVGSGEAPVTSAGVELAIRDWARRDEGAARCLRRADNRRMDYLRELYGAFCPDEDDVEARCLITFSLRIGDPLIAADDGPRSRYGSPRRGQEAVAGLSGTSPDPNQPCFYRNFSGGWCRAVRRPREAYRPERAKIEGLNGRTESHGIDISDPTKRLARGRGAHTVLLALMICSITDSRPPEPEPPPAPARSANTSHRPRKRRNPARSIRSDGIS